MTCDHCNTPLELTARIGDCCQLHCPNCGATTTVFITPSDLILPRIPTFRLLIRSNTGTLSALQAAHLRRALPSLQNYSFPQLVAIHEIDRGFTADHLTQSQADDLRTTLEPHNFTFKITPEPKR